MDGKTKLELEIDYVNVGHVYGCQVPDNPETIPTTSVILFDFQNCA